MKPEGHYIQAWDQGSPADKTACAVPAGAVQDSKQRVSSIMGLKGWDSASLRGNSGCIFWKAAGPVNHLQPSPPNHDTLSLQHSQNKLHFSLAWCYSV